MNTEKNENRFRHSRFTQKRIEEAAKELNLMLKAFEADALMRQDIIDDLRRELEIEKRSKEELLAWIKKADEIGDHSHASTMIQAWGLIQK